jgi:hypothetical protein
MASKFSYENVMQIIIDFIFLLTIRGSTAKILIKNEEFDTDYQYQI